MSKVIKSHSYIVLQDKKVVEAARQYIAASVSPDYEQSGPDTEEEQQELKEAKETKESILRDAEVLAEQQVRQAMEEAESIREQANRDIEAWWQERRSLDDAAVSEARQAGYDAGYKEGFEHAEASVRQEYNDMLQEAKAVLEQAYTLKQQIIQEAEPFLIEVSTGVAQKIIQHELKSSPELVIEMTKSVLARKREKGVVTLCVSPANFSYIQDARDELLLVIDSQAELQILPDSSVGSHGCVVRTAFGSIDARLDTQLKEIKNALQQLAIRNEGAEDYD